MKVRSGKALWVLLTLWMAAAPSLLHLPIWVLLIAVLGTGLHYSGKLLPGKWRMIPIIVMLFASMVGIWFSFDGWFSGDAVLSFFITVVFLKWCESSTNRDFLLLIFAAVILAAIGALYWETLPSLLHMFAIVFMLTCSLVAINQGEETAKLRHTVKSAAWLYVPALPVMVILFLSFPRIPGPLWDLGLAFGLPVKALMEKGGGDHGRVKTIQPGGIHRTNNDDGNVLVAEFEGVVPYKSRLYWRGAVFWNFDGESWHLPDDWDNKSRLLGNALRNKQKFDRELRWGKEPVSYTLRVMPNGGRWLYGLELPATSAPEVFISGEYQLLHIRRINDSEPKLHMRAFLDYGIGSMISEEQRSKGLSWPEGSNPRLLAWGRSLGEKFSDPQQVVDESLKHLATGNYRFDESHQLAPTKDVYDRFFFDERIGGADHLAGSMVMLMRAAGIPARLVSGYRGGSIVALTNFVIVKQSHAHAWPEIWLDDKGWVRIEPKDIVQPPQKKAPKAALEKKEALVMKVHADQIRQEQTKEKRDPQPPTDSGGLLSWKLPDWSALFGGLQKWVIDYDPDRQIELLKGVGMKDSNWLDLMIWAVLGVTGVLFLYLLFWWLGNRKKQPPELAAYRKFCKAMAKKGVAREQNECPRDYLGRLTVAHGEYASAAADITDRYISIRYGVQGDDETVILLQRQVKRFISMI